MGEKNDAAPVVAVVNDLSVVKGRSVAVDAAVVVEDVEVFVGTIQEDEVTCVRTTSKMRSILSCKRISMKSNFD